MSTFSRVLADVSTYGTPHCCARPWHSPSGTFRLSFRSHLLPTNKNGILSSFFTRSICSLGNVEDKLINFNEQIIHCRLIWINLKVIGMFWNGIGGGDWDWVIAWVSKGTSWRKSEQILKIHYQSSRTNECLPEFLCCLKTFIVRYGKYA